MSPREEPNAARKVLETATEMKPSVLFTIFMVGSFVLAV
jgi:hypothetical protein